jgi:hypothetical protein
MPPPPISTRSFIIIIDIYHGDFGRSGLRSRARSRLQTKRNATKRESFASNARIETSRSFGRNCRFLVGGCRKSSQATSAKKATRSRCIEERPLREVSKVDRQDASLERIAGTHRRNASRERIARNASRWNASRERIARNASRGTHRAERIAGTHRWNASLERIAGTHRDHHRDNAISHRDDASWPRIAIIVATRPRIATRDMKLLVRSRHRPDLAPTHTRSRAAHRPPKQNALLKKEILPRSGRVGVALVRSAQ